MLVAYLFIHAHLHSAKSKLHTLFPSNICARPPLHASSKALSWPLNTICGSGPGLKFPIETRLPLSARPLGIQYTRMRAGRLMQGERGAKQIRARAGSLALRFPSRPWRKRVRGDWGASAHVGHATLFTFASELVGRAADLEEDPAAPLRVVAPAQVRHRLLALLVHVHITGCKREERMASRAEPLKGPRRSLIAHSQTAPDMRRLSNRDYC